MADEEPEVAQEERAPPAPEPFPAPEQFAKAVVAHHYLRIMDPASVMAYCDVSTPVDSQGRHMTLGILQCLNPADAAKAFGI
jgi:hypothetical protein